MKSGAMLDPLSATVCASQPMREVQYFWIVPVTLPLDLPVSALAHPTLLL